MLILRRQYHNLLGEPICLDIHRFTNCCQLMITKTNRRWDSLQLLAMAALFVAVFFTANINKILDRLVILSMTIVLMIALVYWRTHAYKESIVLLDNVSGLELTQHYSLLGVHWKRSQFILSSTIIINEAITMHRVIYYLVSIPLSLSTLLLSDNTNESDSKSQTRETRIGARNSNTYNNSSNNNMNNKFNNNNNRLIPLFSNTCPRIDCLRVMYQHINDFKTNTNRAINHKTIDASIKSLNSKSSKHSLTTSPRNGFTIC